MTLGSVSGEAQVGAVALISGYCWRLPLLLRWIHTLSSKFLPWGRGDSRATAAWVWVFGLKSLPATRPHPGCQALPEDLLG